MWYRIWWMSALCVMNEMILICQPDGLRSKTAQGSRPGPFFTHSTNQYSGRHALGHLGVFLQLVKVKVLVDLAAVFVDHFHVFGVFGHGRDAA